jgi:outer membrane protein
LGTEPEPRKIFEHESVGQMLFRRLAIALTVVVGLSYFSSLCHAQAVKLATPEPKSKETSTSTDASTPAQANSPASKVAVIEAFDPATALESSPSGTAKTVPKSRPSVGSAPVAGKPSSRSPIGVNKSTSPDISIAIENSGTVIKIPEKSIATPAAAMPAESKVASGAANSSSEPAAQVKPAEPAPSKISAAAKRATPVVVKALEDAAVFQDPAFQDPAPVVRAEPKAASTPVTNPSQIAEPNSTPSTNGASQTNSQPQMAGQATPVDTIDTGAAASTLVTNETTPTPSASDNQTPIPPNVTNPESKEITPVQQLPMAVTSGVAAPSINPNATVPSVDNLNQNLAPSNATPTAASVPAANAPNSSEAIAMPEQIAAGAPPVIAPSNTTAAPQQSISPAESIAPYWTVEGQLAIKAPPDRSAVVDLESLVWASLAHSPYVQSIKLTPLIRETEIQQAQGAFDPTRFVDSIWNDRSDPVGNTLTTGGPPRLNDKTMNNKAGIRNKNTLGGNLEASQEIILHNSNSLFFVPRQQADTKMFMRYTQPLMRGAGQAYNRATITIAELNTAAAGKDSNQAMQLHVMDLSEAYWQLFYHRSQLLQLRRGLERLKVIASQLENRRDLDLLENQLFRAQAAVKTFESRIARTIADIIDDEQRIRRFVNAPWIQNLVCDEIITGSVPMTGAVVLSAEQELGAAFINRPDVLAVRDEIQAAKVKLNVAENELRPTLNLVTDMYVRGLNGQYDVANSLGDQFANGRPSYSGGLEYQRPRNLVLAKAIKRQRSLELQQILFRLDDRLLDVSREVLSAVAEVEAALAELNASVGSTMATKSELEYLESRWVSSEFLETSQISLNLEQLMDAQQRLVNAEGSWALSQAQYMIALCRLRFSTGTLLTLGILDEPGVQPAEVR